MIASWFVADLSLSRADTIQAVSSSNVPCISQAEMS